MKNFVLHVLVSGMFLVEFHCLDNTNRLILNTAFFLEDNFVDQQSNFITEKAIKDAIRIIESKTKYQIHYETLRFGPSQIFEAGKEVCNLAQFKLAAIFGPESAEINDVIQSLAANLRIPQFQTIPNSKLSSAFTESTNENLPLIFNLYPNTKLLSQAIATLVSHWRSFTVIYESDDGLYRLQESLKRKSINSAVTFRKLGNGPDYRWELKQIKHSEEVNFILDCKASRIFQVLRDAKAVNLMEEYHNYILTDLDAHTLDWSEFSNIRTNITAIRLLDPESQIVRSAVKTWAVKPELIRTRTALLYDALNVFLTSFNNIAMKEDPFIPRLQCDGGNGDKNSPFHEEMAVFLKKKPFKKGILGPPITGPLSFDAQGQRDSFQLQIMENVHKEYYLRHVATWHSDKPDGFSQEVSIEQRRQEEQRELQQKKFKVASRIAAPYLMMKKSENNVILFGNNRYEGYVMDLMYEVCRFLNCTFEFELVPDGMHGNYNPVTKQWNGLIRHLLDRKADLAVCDLTITYERKKAVDFSSPFMTLGISVLYAKPSKEPPELLSFARPFSPKVWLYVATAYLVISLIIFLTARLNPNDWENPHPCAADPKELENIWNIRNCSWLTLGSFMQQGCDLLPKGISTRLATSAWWFFTLIMTAAYTANMAAFLTMERMVPTIKNADDLADQSKIKYGCLKGGATCSFFKETNFSTYHKMWVQMESADPTVFEESNEKGVDRVIRGKRSYAFLMESASIEYVTERECNLIQVGLPIDSKGYGIAMNTDFKFRKNFNEAILKMQEQGTLHHLKDKWWKEMNGGGKCEEDKSLSDEAAAELGLDNVGGVFVVLTVGVITSLLFATCEFLWLVKKIAIKEHIPIKEAFLMEITFAFNIWDRQKKVKKYQSTEELREGEKVVRF